MEGEIVLMLHQILRTGTFKNETYGKFKVVALNCTAHSYCP